MNAAGSSNWSGGAITHYIDSLTHHKVYNKLVKYLSFPSEVG